jgi:hypothetical protein
MIFILSIVLTGCVTSWRPVINPKEDKIVQKNGEQLHIQIYQKLSTDVAQSIRKATPDIRLLPSDWEYRTLRGIFEDYSGFGEVVDMVEAATQFRTLVRVTLFYDYDASYEHQGWCEASFMTLAIVPCYGNLSVHRAEYELLVGSGSRQTYRYTYVCKGLTWIGLFPVVWLNVFTSSHQDVLESTALKFLFQAKQDGYL